jgi:predicted small lipoprotein YifL
VRRTPVLAVLAAACVVTACGKKAPPRPPILYLPAAPVVTAREQGRTAHLDVQVPNANTNGSRPAVIDRLLVYGYTGTPDLTHLDTFFDQATLVASVPIKPEPKPGSDEADEEADQEQPPSTEAPSKLPAQGDTITVSETITPALTIPVPPGKRGRKVPPAQEIELPPPAVPLGPPPDTVPMRGYYVLGATGRDRYGPLAKVATVPLVPPPDAPGHPVVTFTESAITITWTPPAFVRQPVQHALASAPSAPAGAPAASSREPVSAPPRDQAPVFGTFVPLVPPPPILPSTPIGPSYPASAYNVYDIDPGATPRTIPAPGDGTVVAGPPRPPLNSAPLTETTYTDSRMTWGARRCYAVRTVDTYGTMTIESQPSVPTCVTLKDTFPPAAPRGLQAVAAEGAISLIWEANSEPDLAGYLVLRATGDGPLVPITPKPITETTFRDATVHTGERYAYVIVALDQAGNRSQPSVRVQEVAR